MLTAILGMGKSGQSVARYLVGKKEAVIGVDRSRVKSNIPVVSEEAFDISAVGRIVISPGIPKNHAIYRAAIHAGIEMTSDVELALKAAKCRLVAITGTNGKTTAVELTAHVLRYAGYKATAVGNNGSPILDYIEAGPDEILVVELSSFQLELIKTKRFECAAILNITPDHLERYASFEEYKATKMRLFELSEKCELGGGPLTLCRHFGIDEEIFKEASKTFVRPKHRLEFIKEVDQIRFYNDSKGTNVDSVIYATKAIEGPKILIVGGKNKGLDFSVWQSTFDQSVKEIIAIGESREKIRSELHPRFRVDLVEDLATAVRLAFQKARAGFSVVLSPGCSSFDQFKNFEDRGERFKEVVELL